MIQISNCPITDLVRKVVSKNFLWLEESEQIIIECKVAHFKNNAIVENSAIKTYVRKLVATTDTMVNGSTGSVLTPQQILDYNVAVGLVNAYEINPVGDPPAGPGFVMMGEYNFYTMVLGITPIVLPSLLENIILARDQQGKFNI